jgi:WD40 repeat protein
MLPNEKVLSVAISPARSQLVATTRSSGKAYLFNLAQRGDPLVLAACRPAGGNVEGVVFAPDGARFATVCRRTLRLWESDSGKLVRELQAASKGDLLGVAFAPDGATLATVDSEGMVALWNAETGERLQSAQAHYGSAFGVAFSPDGSRLATTGLSDYTLRFWNARTVAPIATFRRTVWKLEGQ